jgi:GT2 family glycosyltransferase
MGTPEEMEPMLREVDVSPLDHDDYKGARDEGAGKSGENTLSPGSRPASGVERSGAAIRLQPTDDQRVARVLRDTEKRLAILEEGSRALGGELRKEQDARAGLTAEIERLRGRLEELEQPTRFRRLVRSIQRNLSTREVRLRAIAERQVLGERGRWESLGTDPRFRLEPESGELPTGWVAIDFEIASPDGRALEPVLYVDDGNGMREETCVRLPPTQSRRFRGLVKLPERVHALRLDPMDKPGEFELGCLLVREVTRERAALSTISAMARAAGSNPSRTRRALARGIRTLRAEGWGGLKREIRDRALAPEARSDYATWIQQYDKLEELDRKQIALCSASLAQSVSFCVVVRMEPSDAPEALAATIKSITGQIYPSWRGVIWGADPRNAAATADARWDICGAAGWEGLLAKASQTLLLFLRAGDQLAEHALFCFADAMLRQTTAVAAYADEDQLRGGVRVEPWFKPDFSPYRLWSQDYIGPRLAFRREAMIARMRQVADQDDALYRLLLSLSPHEVAHVPRILAHVPVSSAAPRCPPESVLTAHLGRVAPLADLASGNLPGTFRVKWRSESVAPLVSIIIPTKDRADLLRGCIESIVSRTDYPRVEIIVIDNGSKEDVACRYLRALESQDGVRVLRHPGEFNYSEINNTAVREAAGSVLVFLNNDIEIRSEDWLRELVGWATRQDVGAVGCLLRYGSGQVQHGGVVIGRGGVAGHAYVDFPGDAAGYRGALQVVREVGAVTAACMAIRKEVFEQVGGFDEQILVAFNDVDLCLRIRKTGRAILYTPFVDIVHFESVSRGADAAPEKQERLAREIQIVKEKHGSALRDDAFHNPNLSLELDAPELAFPPRGQRPWRPVAEKPTIAFLTYRLAKGFGVDVVVAQQVEYFCAHGHPVVVILMERDGHYDDRFRDLLESRLLKVVKVRSNEEAIACVKSHGAAVAIAHTPPFFEVLASLPDSIARVMFDHGEPPAELFPDAVERRKIAARKVEISRGVSAVVAISEFIRRDSGLYGAVVCFNGNDHQLRRRSNLAALQGRLRASQGLGEKFIVLNVTRYLAAERRYKGVDVFVAVREALIQDFPKLATEVEFVLAGRSEPSDQAWAIKRGLIALSNLEDDQLISAYLDCDLYLSTSQWEGYNLGIAQSLALGVPVLASDRGAHSEFGVRTSNVPEQLARWIAEEVERRRSAHLVSPIDRMRAAQMYPWRESIRGLEKILWQAMERAGAASAPRVPAAMAKMDQPAISFIILNRDKPELLLPCVRSIEEHCKVPFEILIGDTGSTDSATLRFYETTSHQVHYLGFYNFSASNNVLAARSRGRRLLFLNNDTKLIRTDFQRALDYLDEHPDVGCLGAYLVYADHRIQHAGVRICPKAPYRGVPEHFDRFAPLGSYPWLAEPREVLAVTGAMLLVDARVFAEFGGFDEVYEEEAQDIDLCLRLRARGLRSVMHPALCAYHYENSTRTVKEAPRDRAEFASRFGETIEREIFPWQESLGLGD